LRGLIHGNVTGKLNHENAERQASNPAFGKTIKARTAAEPMLRINHIDIPVKDVLLHPDRFYRRTVPDLNKLADSMAGPNGQLQPIWVDDQNYLIFGFRRWEAAKLLGWPTISAIRVNPSDPLAAIRDENECRTNLTPIERVELGKMIEAAEAVKARANQTSGKNLAKGQEVGRSAEKAADAVDWSRPTYEAAKKVVEHGSEFLKQAMDEGTISVTDAAKVAKETPDVQRKAVSAVKKGKARTASEVAGNPKVLPELQLKLSQGAISPKLMPDIKRLSKSQQERFLNLLGEGKNPRTALTIIQRVKETKAIDKSIAAQRDRLGFEIPKRLRDDFGDTFLRDSAEQLREMVSAIRKHAKHLPYLLLAEVIDDLESARRKLGDAMPYAVHLECQGQGCEGCRCAGYMPEWRYQERLTELKKEGKEWNSSRP
jgi:ParB-like chromosome segregation protein Spo0J